jgi:DNA (cytosine-5)-methyltransferase 1
MSIPVIDLFAGPGGLGEGFSSLVEPETMKRAFRISLSIEKEFFAHETLRLRSFYRQFPPGKIPTEYFDFVQERISIDDLYKSHPEQFNSANKEAWRAQLGEDEKAVSNEEVDQRISDAINGIKEWLLIGGPPCQAYSVIGRSRRQVKLLDEHKDARVGLYKQYLRILAVHNPAVFVMENVKGLLSAKTKSNSVFEKIIKDLSDPLEAYQSEFGINGKPFECSGYKIYSLVARPRGFDVNNNPIFKPEDFLIYSEKHGIPQTRHRIILLGIRNDIVITEPEILSKEKEVGVEQVLNGLPKIRSGLSNIEDSKANWLLTLKNIRINGTLQKVDEDVRSEIQKQLLKINSTPASIGSEFMPFPVTSEYGRDWFLNHKLGGACNHQSRGHMQSDLLRYLFVSCFGKVRNKSPKLENFPEELLPAHKNVQSGVRGKKFADRFRVQIANAPAKTITSHISKDGHYYIHPDPSQCRSLTVREAARIQTFPDDYYFCGPRTAQFIQVGNAVPPLLANKIAKVVLQIFEEIHQQKNLLEKIDQATF